MKTPVLTVGLFLLAVLAPLHADTLRLRNGTVIEGQFISGNEKGIWFQQALEGAKVYPLDFVESMTFGTFASKNIVSKRISPPTTQAADSAKKTESAPVRAPAPIP